MASRAVIGTAVYAIHDYTEDGSHKMNGSVKDYAISAGIGAAV